MRARTVCLLILCASCAGSPPPAPELPTFIGRPVYDQPVEDSSEDVRQVWSALQSAADGSLPAPSLGQWRQWTETVAPEFRRNRTQLLQELDPSFGRLAQGEASDVLFGAVAQAYLLDDMVSQLLRVEAPPGEEPSTTSFRQSSAERLLPDIEAARRAYANCVRVAPSTSELLRDWSTTCLERSQALEAMMPAPSSSDE